MTLPLRYAARQPYWHQRAGEDRKTEVYAGPALLAALTDSDGAITGCQITWLDPDRPGEKLALPDPDKPGQLLDTRKLRGTKNKAAIRLIDRPGAPRLVIGEGNENVLSAYVAERDEPRGALTSYWAAYDLGHLAGKAKDSIAHPTLKTPAGRPKRVSGPWPEPQPDKDLDIPDYVTELVIIADADSEAFATEMALRRAAARWEREGRSIVIVWPPKGMDLNDVLRAHGELSVKACLAAAAPFGPLALPSPERKTKAKSKTKRSRPAIAAVSSPVDADLSKSSQTGGNGKRPPVRGDVDPLDRRCAFFPLTDLGNAERFCARMQGRFLWCPAVGSQRKAGWLYWDGKRWAHEGADEKAMLAAHETARAIQDEAAAIRDTDQDFVVKATKTEITMFSDRLAMHGRMSEASARLVALAKHASAYLFVNPSALDADPFLFNVDNGTLVIRKTDDGSHYVRFRAHDPADLCTKLANVAYDPEASCPRYDAFLEMVQPKPEDRRFLHQWGGLSVTGDTSEQALTVWWGTGKNGKSTLFNIWAFLFGDYGASIKIETFLDQGRPQHGGNATPDLARLRGVRFLRTSEPERGAKLAEALVKLATGGEPIVARNLHNDFFEFTPHFKLTIAGNYKPQIMGSDEGIWRRVKLVPWTFTVPVEKRVKDFDKILRPEASGILNRLLDGLCDWLDNGLVEPEDVKVATAEYRRDSDPLGRFLEDCTVVEAGAKAQSSVLAKSFNAWAPLNGANQWSNKAISQAMRERGFVAKQSDVMWWLDLRLLKTESDFTGGASWSGQGGPDPPPSDTFPPSHYRED